MGETLLIPTKGEMKWESFAFQKSRMDFPEPHGSPCRSIIHLWVNWTERCSRSAADSKWVPSHINDLKWNHEVVQSWSEFLWSRCQSRGSRWGDAGCEGAASKQTMTRGGDNKLVITALTQQLYELLSHTCTHTITQACTRLHIARSSQEDGCWNVFQLHLDTLN